MEEWYLILFYFYFNIIGEEVQTRVVAEHHIMIQKTMSLGENHLFYAIGKVLVLAIATKIANE